MSHWVNNIINSIFIVKKSKVTIPYNDCMPTPSFLFFCLKHPHEFEKDNLTMSLSHVENVEEKRQKEAR